MRSPFPGMNPYLESPALWPEVHSWLIVELARLLNQSITPKYRAAVEKRVYEESIVERYLEIREVTTGEVVTVIEVVSPKNRRIGEGRDQYLGKRVKILDSQGHLKAIDLRDALPCFVMPLRDGDEGPIVDLNAVMQTVYESAALDLAIDYSAHLVPALSPDDWDGVRSGPKA